MNPIPFMELEDLELVDHFRYVDCRYYLDCLDIACAEDWPGFACIKCEHFKKWKEGENG